MKKNMIKLMAALLAALILAAPVMALAEDEGSEPAPAPVVKEEVKKEAPKAEAPKAEESKPAETKAEAPKAEESKPAETKAEAPKAEESKPAEEAPKAEESKPAEEAPKAEEPKTEQPAETVEPAETEEPAETSKPEAAPEKFTGHVEVKRVGSSELHYGDKVTLKAIVTKANVKYSIRWEAKINGEWKKLATGEKYEFIVKKENAELSYRAVAVADSKANDKESDIFKLPEVTEAPAEEEPTTEEPAAEEPVTEEPVVEEPATEEPVAEEPVAEEPVVEEPVTEEPVVEEPVVEEPVTEEPVVEEPVEEIPAEEEPVEELPAEELPLDETTSEEEIDEEALVEIPEVVDTPLGAAPVISLADAAVRIAADGLSDIFATLPEGTVLNVLSIEGDWVLVEIEVDGLVMQGYIHKKDVLGLPEEEPEADEAGEAVEIPKKVTIFSSRRTVMTRGETVELTSLLEGFEDCSEILYQWECDNGSGFVAVPGANSATYSFKASAMTLSWGWRLTVSYR